MTEKTQELDKLQKMTRVLKELDGKYQQYKKDRIELLKFVESILPPSDDAAAQIKADPGKVDSEILLKLFKATEIENNKIKEELEYLRKNEKVMQEKINKIEAQTKKQVNEEGNALLAKIKSIANTNKNQMVNNFSVINSLEEKIRSQEKIIASLQSKPVVNTQSVLPKLEIREVGIQVEGTSSESAEKTEELKKKVTELQQTLESIQQEYNVE
jgi:hypothetical protein